MSSLGSPNPFFIAGKKAYEVERSLRFNDDDNAYLNRTPSSASNRTTFTLSVWVKRASNLDEFQRIFEAGADTSNRTYFTFDGDDKLEINHRDGGSEAVNLTTTARFRDVSAWYHIVLAIDTTQSTSSDRIKIYVNGTQQTDFDTSTYPNSSKEFDINSTAVHYIGRTTNNTSKFDGYMAEINFIDGFQYDPSYFGETDAITGQWNPKKYTGGYGSNGFYLNFSDNSGTSATTLGKDSSGNGNNFTPNNFATTDAVKDSPTNNFCTFNLLSKDGGTTLSEGNLKISSSNYGNNTGTFFLTSGKWYWEGLGDGYVVAICGNAGQNFATSLSGSGSKSIGYWFGGQAYWDGGNSGTETSYSSTDIVAAALDMDNGTIKFYKNNTLIYDLTFGSGTVPDLSAGVFPNYNNGGVSASRTVNFNFGVDSSFAGNKTAQGNTDGNGIGDFYYAPPSGHLAICSANLPDPTILLPDNHFNTILYTGNDSNDRDITGVGFQPDWLWIKNRQQTDWHQLCDAVRGANKVLFSNTTDGESTDNSNGHVNSFLPDGFNITAGDSGNVNENNENYVAWNWNAGDTDGKTYAVKVVSDSGNKYRFDDFGTSAVTLDLAEGGTYIFDQSDSSNSGHPLRFSTTSDGTHGGGSEYTTGVTTSGTPGSSGAYTQIIVAASAPTLYYYCSVHSGMGGQANTNSTLGSSNFDGTLQSTVKVNATAGFSIVSYTVGNFSGMTMGHGLGVSPVIAISKKRSGTSDWSVQFVNPSDNSTDYMFLNKTDAKGDTSTYFTSTTVKDGFGTGANGDTIIQYVFSEVAGYSKFGSYTGNGNADGTFIFLGFRPAWFVVKRTDTTNNWRTFDAKRSTFNEVDKRLYLDTTNSESTGSDIDFLSNGVKMRNSDNGMNASGGTYIYLAFAESPFKNARAR